MEHQGGYWLKRRELSEAVQLFRFDPPKKGSLLHVLKVCKIKWGDNICIFFYPRCSDFLRSGQPLKSEKD